MGMGAMKEIRKLLNYIQDHMKINAVSSWPMLKTLTSSTLLKHKTTYYNIDEP